ncbi:MAG: UDP-N-acetylmuramoyl-L-alanine--D-glutamate ligase [Coriobacteriales bacterium]|nr:UDP-N-acetylmuramoyl-L-alanine--D-glutamate ligase [Coriobacteriales bacterium]
MCAHAALNTKRAADKKPFFGDVCLLGLELTGQAVVTYFLEHPLSLTSLTIYASCPTPEVQAFAAKLPKNIAVNLDCATVVGHYDTTVASPGISPQAPLYQSALTCSVELISEPELAWRVSPEDWIAITGTNGKTTVTELTAHLLNAAGTKAFVAGNIGIPCIQAVSHRPPGSFIVAELSSYQLHSTVDFAPDVAVLLNITPDHLNWHDGFENYAADKLKLLANVDAQNPVIIDATLENTRSLVRKLRNEGRRVIPLGATEGIYESMIERCGAPEAAYVDERTQRLNVVLNGEQLELAPTSSLNIKGTHNLSNALAAATAALCVGATPGALSAGLTSFKPLEHRLEPCGEVAGVNFINDSKATNTDAAIRAIIAFGDDAPGIKTQTTAASDTVSAGTNSATGTKTSKTYNSVINTADNAALIVLFGGSDKGTALDDLVCACQGLCKYAVCFGEAAARFYAALSPAVPTKLARNLDDAFAQAVTLAQSGDVVLLSPACASFDEFASFEARGAAFKRLVATWEQQNRRIGEK